MSGGASPRLAELKAAYGRGSALERERLLREAATLGTPDAARWLADVAATDEPLAAHAGAALGSIADPRAAAELAQVASSNAPVLVRANAVRALGRSGSPEQTEALTDLVRRPDQPLRVRQEAALALGALGDPSAVPALVAALDAVAADTSPEGEQLRISLVQALGRIPSEAARKFLARHAGRPLSARERAFVLQAMNGSR